MDLTSVMVVAEQFARDGSFGGWHGAHAGIGTLPLLLFGTEAQKAEVSAQALQLRNGCRLLPQRTASRIRRAGRQDPRRPFARRHALRPQRPEDVDHQRRQGRSLHRLRENRRRAVHGVSGRARFPRRLAAAPKKRRWASRAVPPRAVFFDNVPVPVENVLGEIGRGHIIAFNILNIGRLKLGAVRRRRRRRTCSQISLTYAKERKAFGTTIVAFRHDPAQAGRDGDPHLRRRIDDLSRGGPDREPSRRFLLGRARCRRNA